MPKYDIKRGAAIIASVIAEGSQNVEAMGVNEVTMKFTLVSPVVFQVGDWCEVYGNKYVVYRKPEYTKVNERQHEYDLYLVHEFYKLQDSLLMGVDKNATLNEKQFYLTGNLQAFADLVLLNANRNDSGWTLGTVETTGAKTLQFDGENILASLNRIAAEFETEFWVEGKTISFTKRLQNSGITLSYGENKGLISISKGNKDANATIFTRLFVEGSERNLPSYTNYGFKRLQLPASYNGKVDNASAIAQFGVIEKYVKFDDVFPQHTGTITAVGDEFTFYDTALPFDVNAQLLPGVTAYVAFQSGNLAGYNFDISSFDNATKKFVINVNEDEKTTTLPNATLKPAVGDKYIVFDIQMPQTHITAAENELLTRANELLAQGSDIDFNDAFSGNCDPLYFKRNTITPVLGQYVRLFETNPAIDVTKRMSKISRDLQNEWKYDITFTDKIQVNTVVREYIKDIEETLVINETVDRTIINRDAVRRAAQRIDILRGDIFDPDGYFDGTHLKPQTIEAIMATFGYKSGNFALEGVAITLNAGGVSNNFNITAGKLIHFSYDIGGAYVWDMGSMISAFTDSAQGYYIYAKISKTALTGSWVVNNTKLQVDNEAGYYTLLIGRVYPVVNGKREIDLLYGVTNIVGNRIQTGIIQDLVGNNYWNLDTGQMRITGSVTIVGTDSNVYTKTETNAKVDVKNTNHITQPTNYIAGDTWELQADTMLNGIQYKTGDVLTTLTSSTSFVSAHWDKRVRYVGSDDIKIGTVNLFENSEVLLFNANNTGSGTSVLMEDSTGKFYRATPDADKAVSLYGGFYSGFDGAEYLHSFDVRHSHTAPVVIMVYRSDWGSSRHFTVQPNTWTRLTLPITIAGTFGFIWWAYTNGIAIDYRRIMTVKGNKQPESWSPNPNDIIAKVAKIITISGTTQIIKVDKNGNKTPASQFTVTGTAQNTTITTWEYNVDGGGFSTGLPTGVTRSGNDVTIDPAAVTFKTLSIRASDGTYSDVFTVGRAVDGADGTDGAGISIKGSVATYAALPSTGLTTGDAYLVEADGLLYIWDGTQFPANGNGIEFKGDKGDSGYTILLSNESHTFAGSETAALAGSTTCDVITYKGDSSIAHTISIGTLQTGLTATVSGSTITFTASTSLTVNGTVDITINADGKTFVRKFSFAISFKGVQGKSVINVDVEFAKTTSPTVAPAGGWNTIAPTWEQGYYIWTRTKTTFSDATSTTSPAMNPAGQAGTNGRGISSMVEQYYLSTSKTVQVGGSWVDNTAPTWEAGKYLWSRLKIVYTNPTETVYTEPNVSEEWEAVNELQFSDVNLMPNSKGVFTGSSIPSFANTFKPGDKLTLGATGRLNGSVFLYVGGGTGWAGMPVLTFPESEITYKEVTTIVPATDGSGAAWGANFTPYINIFAGADGNSQIKEIKLIKGNRTSKAWSPAPEDIQNELASFASDGILKPVEKSGLKTTMDDIAKAHAALLTRAGNYPSVSTTLLASNYSTLTSYINPLLASMTTDSTIVRATFDSYFSNYFTQRKTVEENIEAANKTNTDAANALVPTFMGSAFPSNPKTGSKWFDTATMLWKEWNGSSWVTMLDSDKMTAKYLRDALVNNTDTIGGLILTSVVGVRNSANQVTAYINGNGNTYGEGIAIATGVTDFGLATETQKGVDRHNGSGFRAGNKLWWDKDGNAKVGGFFLLNDKISSALTGERTEIVSNGIIRGFNSGGNKGYELKSVNGRYALTFYAPDGSVAYKIGQDGSDIPASAESFTAVGMYKFTGLPTTYAALTTAQKSTASSLIKTNSSRSGGTITVSLTMATKYLYNAGNNASTPTNAPYNGYKDSNSDRTDHVSDGWYGLDFPPQFGVIGVYDLVFIQDGKIVSGSNTGVQISYAASLAFLNAGVYTQAAGAKDRHYPTLTLSEAVNDSIEVFYTISEDSTYGTVDGSIVLESGTTATTTAQSLGANFLETSPTIEARITITSISITETTAVSDNTDRTITY